MGVRWIKHDRTDALPPNLPPTTVIEVEADNWGASHIPAGLITGWDIVQRYRPTGLTVTPEYLKENA